MSKKFLHVWDNWIYEKETCKEYRTCTKKCGVCYDEREKHDFGNWVYQQEGQCTTLRRCNFCGKIEYGEITHDFGEWEPIQSTSCNQIRKCKRCGKIETKNVEHQFGNWSYHTPNSCDQVRICSNCGFRENRVVHKMGNFNLLKTKCIAEQVCTICGEKNFEQREHQWSVEQPYIECIDKVLTLIKQQQVYLNNLQEGAKIETGFEPNLEKILDIQMEITRLDNMKLFLTKKRLTSTKEMIGRFCTHCYQLEYLGDTRNRAMKKGFLSYSHANSDIANHIDNSLKKRNLYITRDIRDINVTDNIQEFMNRILDVDYTMIILSDSYLKSTNCMYEAVNVVNALAMKKCILFTFVTDIEIASDNVKQYYLLYWKKRLNDAIQNGESPHTIQIYQSITDNIWEFLNQVSTYKYIKTQSLTNIDANMEYIINKIYTIS